ncbi:MAG: FAD-dependent oxidoreductase [Chloroflexota bacterium]|nr:MAG: FAD-dependent oxidoreductase [Chloroflexota bacterium]
MARATRWDRETDVLVIGSGAAALSAAILAHDTGAKVLIVERSDKFGGTSAVSGGMVWIPMNHVMAQGGIQDSPEEALTYCKRLTAGRASDELVETYVHTGHKAVRYLEDHTPLRFGYCGLPDYFPEEEGGKPAGRGMSVNLFDKNELGEWADKLRPPSSFILPVTAYEIYDKYQLFTKLKDFDMTIVMDRMEKGIVALGQSLVASLAKGCLDRKIPILLETRAGEFIRQDGRIMGVRVEQDGKERFFGAGAVVLATGGYEWNERLKANYLQGPVTHPNSPPFAEGDGLIMAAEVGADLANMGEAWWMPSGEVPGEKYEGRPLSYMTLPERGSPHTIMVNRYGRRFINEASDYDRVGKSLYAMDHERHGYRNLPCWAIVDSQYREKYFFLAVMPNDPDPDWLTGDDTLAGLAQKVGINPQGLEATVARYNAFAREGKDLEFGRGNSLYDRYMGDPEYPNPAMGTIEKPPFYAHRVQPGALGTKGGPRTNAKGQVLSVRGTPIPGLYAAGNVTASVAGPSYYGGGSTLGPALVFGYISGINAAQEALRTGK